MTPSQAAWVRARVWTQAMRNTYAETPGFYTACACQWALTSWCLNDRCDRCHRASPQPTYATVICKRSGTYPAYFTDPYKHKTPSITGLIREHVAMVWLADRVCRWICLHDCHRTPRPRQLHLFEVTP